MILVQVSWWLGSCVTRECIWTQAFSGVEKPPRCMHPEKDSGGQSGVGWPWGGQALVCVLVVLEPWGPEVEGTDLRLGLGRPGVLTEALSLAHCGVTGKAAALSRPEYLACLHYEASSGQWERGAHWICPLRSFLYLRFYHFLPLPSSALHSFDLLLQPVASVWRSPGTQPGHWGPPSHPHCS